MNLWNRLFLNPIFFIVTTCIALVFVLGFLFPIFFPIGLWFIMIVGIITVFDLILLLSQKKAIKIQRLVPKQLSNSDANPIQIQISNRYWFNISVRILEELPDQLQTKLQPIQARIKAKKKQRINYQITPTQRGEYQFYNTNVFVSSPLHVLSLKFIGQTNQRVKVYPSFLKLNQYSLKSIQSTTNHLGNQKVRKIGNSLEFEQIKEYVRGDDVRTINWKATAKHQKLMVNQFIDEKSQQVYCVIDKGRSMKMPFDDLSLLDYAINSTLVLANIVLQNQDKFGLFTFSRTIDNILKSDKKSGQIQRTLQTLYNITTDFKESDFGVLYSQIKTQINHRSLIFLYTNFEGMDSLHRQLPYMQAINKRHVLVPIFFRNTELEEFVKKPAQTTQEIYQKTIAEKFLLDKKLIVKELNKHGIQSILTHPKDLSIQVLNNYITIKQKAIL